MLDQVLIRTNPTAKTPGTQPATIPVVLIRGDGIGPEITHAARTVISAACPRIAWIEAEGGADVMARGLATGLPRETLGAIEETGIVLKGPMATPVGHGGKSANVTLRKMYELYGNIRPIKMLPGVAGPFQGRAIDFTIVRENVEDLYAGIEHMQTPDVAQCLKLITRQGSEKISRLAFALAEFEGRRKVTCATKANIMKMTEGMLQHSFERVAEEFPYVNAQHMIVDNCAHQMVMRPEEFEVVVTSNMNGDILSDLAAGLVGGLGLAPSANLGDRMAMFEAVHGSAPDIAGQDRGNPTALILAGAMMMRYLGLADVASRIEAAVRAAYANGQDLPADVARPGKAGSTTAFTDRVLETLDTLPLDAGVTGDRLDLVELNARVSRAKPALKRGFHGVDIFVEWHGSVEVLARKMQAAARIGPFELSMISNRGTIMWPNGSLHADTVPHWRCRFFESTRLPQAEDAIPELLSVIGEKMRWMHVEKLEAYNDMPAYSRAQGECSSGQRG